MAFPLRLPLALPWSPKPRQPSPQSASGDLFGNITNLNQDESHHCVHCNMPVLDNPQHEKACLLRASGETQVDAYAQAFDQSEDSGANNSSRFFRQPYIRARVTEIKARRTTLADLNEAWVLVNLKAIAKNAKAIGDANLDDFFGRYADGRRAGIDLSEVPRSKMAALDEVTVEEYMDGSGEDAERIKRTKVKLRSSNEARAALELIGKHLGMWPSKVGVSDPNGDPLGTGALAALVPVINLLGKPEGL
jgi:hypothetical protein